MIHSAFEILVPGVQCIPKKCVQYGIWCRGILRPLLSCPHLPLLLTFKLIIATTSLIIIIAINIFVFSYLNLP